jgi:hypothetical protein
MCPFCDGANWSHIASSLATVPHPQIQLQPALLAGQQRDDRVKQLDRDPSVRCRRRR